MLFDQSKFAYSKCGKLCWDLFESAHALYTASAKSCDYYIATSCLLLSVSCSSFRALLFLELIVAFKCSRLALFFATIGRISGFWRWWFGDEEDEFWCCLCGPLFFDDLFLLSKCSTVNSLFDWRKLFRLCWDALPLHLICFFILRVFNASFLMREWLLAL